ncbi:uracil-DNA glycosylase-like protein [Hysterangium stoloniferum]|nr:uracil-DNA glycosylase-like protein [Hysterangium stoloniferum]
MSSKPLLYLEDVEPTRLKATNSTASESVGTVEGTSQESKGKAQEKSLKRQISISDMFSKAACGTAKRQRLGFDATITGVRKSLSLGAVPPLNSVPLNLDAFRASLNNEERVLLSLELETMGKSWLKVLTDEIKKPYFITLKRWLVSEGLSEDKALAGASHSKSKIYPPAKDIYSWSHTPLGRVRVVIIGQDPYHAYASAIHLYYGVQPPPSLKNIYAELNKEYPDFKPPDHGNLSSWASNGVLLLNTCLTVRAHEAGSHSNKGWETFTDRLVDIIDRYGGANLGRDGESPTQKTGRSRGVVFLAWGAWAQKRVARLDKKKHLILTSAHPSPLSAYRGFFGNNHFRDANGWLEEKYGRDGIVDWCTLE